MIIMARQNNFIKSVKILTVFTKRNPRNESEFSVTRPQIAGITSLDTHS